jgi:hypothetical protein
MCCKKTSWVELHFEEKKHVCIPSSFLVINVCNQGKTSCSPCIMQSALVRECLELLAATYFWYIRLVSVVPSYCTKRIHVYFMFNVS